MTEWRDMYILYQFSRDRNSHQMFLLACREFPAVTLSYYVKVRDNY